MAKLYLFPVNISDAPLANVIPSYNDEIMAHIRYFVVENVRTARRFLRKAIPDFPIDDCVFYELNSHTEASEIHSYLTPLRQGYDMGVMSEAGCPAVADPGAQVVAIAQREHYSVVPLVGPSSILLALMGSGFNGQGFTFHGYLPIKQQERVRKIKEIEADSARTSYTQIFIETPYRNSSILKDLCSTLRPGTLVCVATALTDEEKQSVVTLPAHAWRNAAVPKEPTIFLIQSQK